MNYEAVAKADTIREVGLQEWGKVILEEVLLQAALLAPNLEATGDTVTVTLSFSLKANQNEGTIEVSTPGAVEKEIVTRLHV